MKKFWNLMLAVLVMLGAAACAENVDSVNVNGGEGLSFYADFVGGQTRTDLVYDESAELWKTVWEGNETIWVRGADFIAYEFTNSVEEPNKFTCKTEGVNTLVGGSVVMSMSNDELSKVGKKGVSVFQTISNFDPKSTIVLEAENAFLRYNYEGEGNVTLTISSDVDPEAKYFYYGGENQKSITFEGAAEDKWVSVSVADHTVNLSYTIDGELCGETKLEILPGKIYNLGTLAEPAVVETKTIYFVPNDNWKMDNAWFVAHLFNSIGGYADVTLTDADADGVYECAVPADMEGLLFCRINPAYTEFGWNDEVVTDRVWNQTADLTIGEEPENYFYLYTNSWGSGVWGDANYVVGEEPFYVSLIGFGDDWGTDYDMTADGDYYVYKNKAIAATDQFKVRIAHDWVESYGMPGEIEPATITVDARNSLVQGGKNMSIAAGTYDIYFNYNTKDFYVMTPGKTPTDDGGSAGASTWALAGEFNSWGNTEMLTTSVNGLYVAKDITIADYGKFKVKDVNTWDISYGGGFKYLNSNIWTKTYSNGSDFAVVKGGTYDIYFDKTNERVYVMAAGTSYSSATEQTEEGPAPDLSGASWGLVGSHNSWGTPDVKMEWNGSMYVAQSVTLTGEFKVRANESWTENYGSGSTITVNNTSGTTVYENGGNCKVASGTYDVYFDLQGKKIWVKTPGSTAPSK